MWRGGWLVLVVFVCGSLAQDDGYDYALDNECTINLQHDLLMSPLEQEIVWYNLSLFISDLRMVPDVCRRPLAWLLCVSSFPSSPPTSCFVTRSDCEFVIKSCEDFGVDIDCANLFPDGNDSEGGNCGMSVEEAQETPNAVVTCLEDYDEEIQCCLDPFTKDGRTEECVISCPQYQSSEGKSLGLTYAAFGCLWLSTIVFIIVFIPVLSNTPAFPKDLFPVSLIMYLCWIHSAFLTIYPGIEDTVCGDEDNFLVGLDNHENSDFCFVQSCFFTGFIFGLENMLLCLALSFCYLCCNLTSGDAKVRKRLAHFRVPVYILCVVSFLGGFFFQFALAKDDPEQIGFTWGYSCGFAYGIDNPVFIAILVYAGLIYLFQLIGFFYLVRKSWHLFSAVRPLLVFLIFMDYNIFISCLHSGYFGDRISEEFPENLAAYSSCVATRPREVDNGCEFEEDRYFPWLIVFYFSITLLPTVICLVLYPVQLIIEWWMETILNRKMHKFQDSGSGSSSSSRSGSRIFKSQRSSGRLSRSQESSQVSMGQ